MVEGEVVGIWIQQGMLKYSLKLSQGLVLFHECGTISYNAEGGLTSLYYIFHKPETAWYGVQGGCLICNRRNFIP